MKNGSGALPDKLIREMLDAQQIKGINSENINPGSVDIPLGKIFRINGMIHPSQEENLESLLETIGASEHSPDSPLEVGAQYLAQTPIILNLPNSVYGFSNPKSTSGRLNVRSRVIADRNHSYDTINPSGFSGTIWNWIVPNSFPVKLESGMSFSQIRFFNNHTRLSQTELEIALAKYNLIYNSNGEKIDSPLIEKGGSIYLTINASSGWECLGKKCILDLSRRDYSPEQFFRPIKESDSLIELKQGQFYIFYTTEYVRVPPHLACEMRPIDPRIGEFRSHFAGFIDPGWGFGSDGKGKGRPIVLEIIPFEDMLIRNRQIIARIKFERMTNSPEYHYDELDKSNYTQLSPLPRLSKHFKM